MATFPETVVPNYSLSLIPKWQTVKNTLGAQYEQRTSKQLYFQCDVIVNFSAIPGLTAMMTLWDFYNARKGSAESFYIYDPQLHRASYPAHVNLFVGTADGVEDTFDIPGRSTSSQAIEIDGVDQASGWSILTGGGSSSSDRVQFTSAPTSGGLITTNFTGILRVPVCFAKDNMSFEMFEADIYRTGQMRLHGLRFG